MYRVGQHKYIRLDFLRRTGVKWERIYILYHRKENKDHSCGTVFLVKTCLETPATEVVC